MIHTLTTLPASDDGVTYWARTVTAMPEGSGRVCSQCGVGGCLPQPFWNHVGTMVIDKGHLPHRTAADRRRPNSDEGVRHHENLKLTVTHPKFPLHSQTRSPPGQSPTPQNADRVTSSGFRKKHSQAQKDRWPTGQHHCAWGRHRTPAAYPCAVPGSSGQGGSHGGAVRLHQGHLVPRASTPQVGRRNGNGPMHAYTTPASQLGAPDPPLSLPSGAHNSTESQQGRAS